MTFNSLIFAIFLAITFILYWIVTKERRKTQNLILLVASYVFYGWWDWRFLTLIIFTTSLNYFGALSLQNTQSKKRRKLILWACIIGNIGLLGYFKYYNFFTQSLTEALQSIGIQVNTSTLSILLPVGISFYTFQALSYTIDIYRKHLVACKDPIAFFVFVAFFPQLVAGPIERATHLLPQFERKRSFDPAFAITGLRLILWGLFAKVVVADNCAVYANQIYGDHENSSALSLILGTFYFSIQIYGDFCGYSNVATGTCRLFGFDLMRNFRYPYFSRDIAEFWRRWHISLNTWFRDYVYIPLGGSRDGTKSIIKNIFIVFLVSGLWHGAKWTFILWGGMNALFFIPLLLSSKNRLHTGPIAEGRILPNLRELIQILSTFALVNIAWVLFRSDNINQALEIYTRIFTGASGNSNLFSYSSYFLTAILLIFVTTEWLARNQESPFAVIPPKSKFLRRTCYFLTALAILLLGTTEEIAFIYFQF